jgi:ubiquitin carboxyl-terminal hydrolase 12/46
MGQGTSRPDKIIQDLPEDERYFGFENFGNTCYCNSVLQALYFCTPFRQRVLQYASQLSTRSDTKESILTCLAELFAQVCALFLVETC